MQILERSSAEAWDEAVGLDLSAVLEWRPRIFRPVKGKKVSYSISEVVWNPFLAVKGMKSVHWDTWSTIEQAKWILALNMDNTENRYDLFVLPDLFREGIVHVFLTPKSWENIAFNREVVNQLINS